MLTREQFEAMYARKKACPLCGAPSGKRCTRSDGTAHRRYMHPHRYRDPEAPAQ